ncbi:unnamed protein product [Schistosoma mattheei]|uniref:Uncharacterized protein n=1 Tax=Schistosoma mattheei TaxID=31246 RepID=A0A3P8JQS6_9TREM|nr:unnamed protein product [Schistosoma mattheei]
MLHAARKSNLCRNVSRASYMIANMKEPRHATIAFPTVSIIQDEKSNV